MEIKEILSFIEDKDIKENDNWYFHATSADIYTIQKILEEGIKSAYLRNERGNHFNGKYYISLYKNTEDAEALKSWLKNCPKFIIQNISPFHADRSKFKFRQMFINTRIPLRTSEWDGEFHEYLKIDPVKIVALEYSLSHTLFNLDESNIKNKMEFLKNMILYLEKTKSDLPIYDIYSKREINKKKVLTLNL